MSRSPKSLGQAASATSNDLAPCLACRLARAGRPGDALLEQFEGVRLRIGLRPVADRRVEGAAVPEAVRPGDRVVAHGELRAGVVDALVQTGEDMEPLVTRPGGEG